MKRPQKVCSCGRSEGLERLATGFKRLFCYTCRELFRLYPTCPHRCGECEDVYWCSDCTPSGCDRPLTGDKCGICKSICACNGCRNNNGPQAFDEEEDEDW